MTQTRDERQQAEQRGRRAETLCGLTLRFLGWQVLARRFSCGRGSEAGEVDIVALKGSVLAFIEVKSRPTVEEALQAVVPAQQQRIARAAEAWMAQNPAHASLGIRFDVMVVPASGRPHLVADAWRP